MDKDRLLVKSREYRRKADEILRETNIISLLDEHGKVTFEGSYSYDLMMNLDIDIYVHVAEMDKVKALEIFSDIVLAVPGFYAYKFNDFVNNETWPGVPRGFCFNLQRKDKGEKQKMDIWFLTKEQYQEIFDYKKVVKENLNEENKLAILALKEYRNENIPKLSSVTIYDAVFNDGIMTIEKFQKYLAER